MTEPIRKTQTSQSAQNVNKPKKQDVKKEQKTSNKPSIGRLLLNRAGAVIMTPIAGVAGVLTIVTGGINGAVNPHKTFDQGMTEGIKAAGQGADMLESMWNGKYF